MAIVSYSIQTNKPFNSLEIFPISQYTRGSIPSKHLELALNFAKESNTDVFDENRLYGTYISFIILC